MKNKHIAMWACPRSRSTAVTRAFEQLDRCIIYDEPLIGAFMVQRGLYPQEEINKFCETDYKKVIQHITGELPDNKLFSFQKHMAIQALPEFGRGWLKLLNNFFLIRHPKEIILSRFKILNSIEEVYNSPVGLKELANLYDEIEELTGEKPLVIHSNDIVENPQATLQYLCDQLNIVFSEKMLNWDSKPKETKLSWIENTPFSGWYSQAINSSMFIKPKSTNLIEIPDNLIPILDECMPFYERLLQKSVVFN